MELQKEHTVCFTGHRMLPKEAQPILPKLLDETVETLIREGYDTFLAGGALGFDTLAEEAVFRAKRKYPDVRLVLILPCEGQDIKWKASDRAHYAKLRSAADGEVLLSESYYDGCMQVRNRYMVDHSTVCVCFVSHSGGGSAQTVTYARKKGCAVWNVNPDNPFREQTMILFA